ncbi:hypothetical protein ANCCEY_10737 [Ancylostoma ceylanicum]|uniref:Uncharacterized protein n=1 Tax=Ancylostoma ceylanicum TaxID=53326 RepID=A0A0D6LG68_9BILA|nr:hypothetical protein ANCCEY_10737 [Ancylostoma ceylanicum]
MDPVSLKDHKPTKKPEPAASTSTQAPAPPTASKINVTVNYIQFHTGQAPVYVNKHTQAVVVAVIEGLILGAILALVIFRCYRRSKLRAAGLYPSSSDYPPSGMRNSVYYDNGGSLNYPRSMYILLSNLIFDFTNSINYCRPASRNSVIPPARRSTTSAARRPANETATTHGHAKFGASFDDHTTRYHHNACAVELLARSTGSGSGSARPKHYG